MKLIAQFLITFFMLPLCADSQEAIDTITIARTDVIEQPMKLFVGVLGKGVRSAEGEAFVETFKHCAEWSSRFSVTLKYLDAVPKKKRDIQKLFDEFYDCALFITYTGPQAPVEWRLYDTAQGSMLEGKKIRAENGKAPDACVLAAAVMHELTNEPQLFLSKLVYRKRDKRGISSLILTNFDGQQRKTLVQSKRILVAPRWNNDAECPMLLYSEFTPNNVRLMMADMLGHAVPVLDIDGTTVGVSFAHGSDDVVYCHSGSIWRYHFDKKAKKGLHSRVIHEPQVCACPVLMPNGDVLYCHRGAIKKYDAATKEKKVVLQDGYCVAPTYSPVSDKIVYTKKMGKQMQLWVYDLKSGSNEQLSFASNDRMSSDCMANKTDPCWAPDGIHVAFCWERKGASRIGVLNTLTKQYRFITPEDEQCSYPAWSGNILQV